MLRLLKRPRIFRWDSSVTQNGERPPLEDGTREPVRNSRLRGLRAPIVDCRQTVWNSDSARRRYRTTMILDHPKIFERTDDLARWLANLTAERNHLNFRDRSSRSRDRRSNSRSSSFRKSPSRHDTANIFWPGTTNATEIKHNFAPSPAPSTCKAH
jgi:hypothetical protein